MYDKTLLLEILLREDCRTIDNDGKPYAPSTPVYDTVSREMHARGNSITAKHVYVIIRENRNGYRDLLLKHYGINKDQLYESTDDSTFSENPDVSTSSVSMQSKMFNLVISAENWRDIKPEKKVYGNRIYWVLKSGWTDIVAEKLWQQQKLYCTFRFKKHNVSLKSEARCYVCFRGECAECAANITGTLFKEPPNNTDVIFECRIENICTAKHTAGKKRQLKGKRRELTAGKMINEHKNAITFCRKEAQRLKKFGDKNPPILPTTSVLRKAKEESFLKQHGFLAILC